MLRSYLLRLSLEWKPHHKPELEDDDDSCIVHDDLPERLDDLKGSTDETYQVFNFCSRDVRKF